MIRLYIRMQSSRKQKAGWTPATVVSLAFLIAFAVLVGLTGEAPVALAAAENGYPNGHLLVEPEWLAAHLHDESLRIIDLRPAEQYHRFHAPGARSIDTWQALVDTDAPVMGWILGREEFQTLMQNMGVNEDSIVAIYDRSDSLSASRLFYALELYGHTDQVRIVNGGFAAWTAAGLPLSNEPPKQAKGNFTARLQKERISDADYIEARLDAPDVVVLDNRSLGEFIGEDVRAARGGRIPGAVNVDWRRHIVDGPVNRFKTAEELRALYAGVASDKEVIPYCQTNVRGAHAYFVLRLLGYENIRPYEGSWSEWGNDPKRPIESGPPQGKR